MPRWSWAAPAPPARRAPGAGLGAERTVGQRPLHSAGARRPELAGLAPGSARAPVPARLGCCCAHAAWPACSARWLQVYKILVKRSPEESWVVFRRYTDFSRLNDKLKDMFPGFRLALPPKRWFKDNYNPDFLEDRQLGLQAFLQNLVAHKDIANCLAVREFLCLDDPPGPFDSLEESRAFCETLEETNYRLQKELLEKQREVDSLKKLLNEKQLHIETIEKRIRDLSLGKGQTRRMSGEESECSGEVESSAVEADQGALGDDSCSDKETHEACWSGSLTENSLPEIEVAEVAYTADEEE
ncbi:sorting nexin-16 isoform X3 [Pelodiscus sinensis]|uniref:sorting nexin-16 isoform X3 n=1 Tax=Pelodiscus sinensis TaxID=13735 RepID=UPI003F6B71C3